MSPASYRAAPPRVDLAANASLPVAQSPTKSSDRPRLQTRYFEGLGEGVALVDGFAFGDGVGVAEWLGATDGLTVGFAVGDVNRCWAMTACARAF